MRAMAQPNYQFEKRRRENEKKAKKAEKLKRKREGITDDGTATEPEKSGEAGTETPQV